MLITSYFAITSIGMELENDFTGHVGIVGIVGIVGSL